MLQVHLCDDETSRGDGFEGISRGITLTHLTPFEIIRGIFLKGVSFELLVNEDNNGFGSWTIL